MTSSFADFAVYDIREATDIDLSHATAGQVNDLLGFSPISPPAIAVSDYLMAITRNLPKEAAR